MSQTSGEDAAFLTSIYRREATSILAAALGGSRRDSTITAMHQQLGRNALEHPLHGSLEPSSVLTYCHVCGSLLQAGVNGTNLRLRSMKRSRTRRRRASRRRAAEYRAKSQASAGGGRTWKHSDDIDALSNELLTLQRVTDGTCRNAVVITCGCCYFKHKFKGLPPRKQTNTIVIGAKRDKGHGHRHEKNEQSNYVEHSVVTQASMIQVPRVARTNRISKAKQRKGISDSRKLQNPKHKKQAGKVSGLQDFLNSLND